MDLKSGRSFPPSDWPFAAKTGCPLSNSKSNESLTLLRVIQALRVSPRYPLVNSLQKNAQRLRQGGLILPRGLKISLTQLFEDPRALRRPAASELSLRRFFNSSDRRAFPRTRYALIGSCTGDIYFFRTGCVGAFALPHCCTAAIEIA